MFNSYDFKKVYEDLKIDTKKLGCVMLDVDGFEKTKEVFTEEDYYVAGPDFPWVNGFVAHPGHLTLLYGLFDFTDKMKQPLKDVLKDWKLEDIEIEKFDKFDTPDKGHPYYCVIAKIKRTDNLYEAHKRISLLPHINTFPDYTPHVTIAYIKHDEKRLNQILSELNKMEFDLTPVEVWADNNSKNKLLIGRFEK